MNLKKLLLISIGILTLSTIMIIIFNNMDNKENNIISNINKDTEVINSNMITMMYETDAGTGIYEETKDTTWPESGYIFNENLSGCENGGELEYNSINKTVNLLSNKSDNCYVYFDKYDGVWIDNVSVTNVTGSSVTLDISATSENGNITTYYYSLNDSEEYQETTSNPITINDLNKLTEYKISIYAIDNTNARSNIYEVIVTTIDESGPVINSVSVSNINSVGFTLTVDATSDVGIERYYFYVNGDGENYAGTSTINNYTFDTLNSNTDYDVLVFAENINGIYSEKYSLNVKTSESEVLLTNYIKNLYFSQENNDIYYHTGASVLSAQDSSYRYLGPNPDNYVCFGSNETACPEENLYRIIGVFDDKVKLIKSTSFGRYIWNSGESNTWNETTKPDIYYTLNETFLDTISLNWQNKISEHQYSVGGMRDSMPGTAKECYDLEVGTGQSGYIEVMKIGLMYVSDYGFATSDNNWAIDIFDYRYDGDNTAATDNWIYPGVSEWTSQWTISPGTSGYAFYLTQSGYIYAYDNTVTFAKDIRPCFYLKSNVTYSSGSGTESDPIRLS